MLPKYDGRAAALRISVVLLAFLTMPMSGANPAGTIKETEGRISLQGTGPEKVGISWEKARGLYRAPMDFVVDGKRLQWGGFYAHIGKKTQGFETTAVETSVPGQGRVRVAHTVRHHEFKKPIQFNVMLGMEGDGLRVRVDVDSGDQHLDRLGLGDFQGTDLAAQRMFFGRMYVLDRPLAFEHEHNYNTCRFWCWTMDNGLSMLEATSGPARGFRYNPAFGRYDLYTYCEPSIEYQFFVTARGAQAAIAGYRKTIEIPAPSSLKQLPGLVGVMAAYPIAERYEDFLEEWTGRGAHRFVWLSYWPAPGDRQRVKAVGGLYAVYDTYLDFFSEGPRKGQGWSPEMVQYRDNGKMVRGYWSSTWLLPELYVPMATTRVMGVCGREYRDDAGNNAFVPTSATRYSNMAITRAEVNPAGVYLDVHASKTPHHFFDSQKRHHPASEHMRGEKALFDFMRSYLGNAPVWSEGGGEDYAGLMDAGWFMDYRPPQELGICAAKWQYYPFIDEVHRERLLNMSIYYPLDRYDTNMVSLAVLFGRPQAVSVYYGTLQDDVAGRLQVYYMTQAFHEMLGLSRMERIDFFQDDIARMIVSYSNGARVWANRSAADWEIEGQCLPPEGYLVRGPAGFLEYRARQKGGVADFVHASGYDYFSSESPVDFGPVVCDGALAILQEDARRLVVYEAKKPKGGFVLKLGQIAKTRTGQRVEKVTAVLTGDRRVALEFPDFRQPADGLSVEVRPVEMRNVLRYEIQLQE